MNISKIELVNFRNYNKIKIDDFKKTNIIIGNNGVGKTSILESIYFGSLTKSFKSSSELHLINKDSIFLKVKIELKDENKTKKLEIKLDEKGKKTKINNTFKKKLSDYISQYKVIIFSPDEVKIIKESPVTRRNYLNIEISQISKTYVKNLNMYNSLIKNKNDYLKKLYLNSNLDTIYLDVLDTKIAEIGIIINSFRKEYIEKINNNIEKIFKKFNKNDSLFINYVSDFNLKNESDIKNLLKKNRKKEITLGMTTTGIHRDDYEFIHNQKNAKEYSSQGTQKLIVLSMKFAEIKMLIDYYGIVPVLLLDDLFSELDISNRNNILSIIKNKVQTFITTTDIKNIDDKLINKSRIINLEEMV